MTDTAGERLLERKRNGVVKVDLRELGFTLKISDATLERIAGIREDQLRAVLKMKDYMFR